MCFLGVYHMLFDCFGFLFLYTMTFYKPRNQYTHLHCGFLQILQCYLWKSLINALLTDGPSDTLIVHKDVNYLIMYN